MNYTQYETRPFLRHVTCTVGTISSSEKGRICEGRAGREDVSAEVVPQLEGLGGMEERGSVAKIRRHESVRPTQSTLPTDQSGACFSNSWK